MIYFSLLAGRLDFGLKISITSYNLYKTAIKRTVFKSNKS